MLAFLIARDHMHQNQWLAAIEELKADGIDETPVPVTFPLQNEHQQFAYQFVSFAEGEQSAQGRWANGLAPEDGGQFEYVAQPQAHGPVMAELPAVDPRVYSTLKQPTQPSSS